MSTKNNYSDMFNLPIFNKDQAKIIINIARKDFKRSDMVLWFLKYYKYSTISKAIAEGRPEDHVKERKWLANFEKKHPDWKGQKLQSISSVQSFLQHNIDLNIHKINNFRFNNESFDKLSEIFGEIEAEWRESLDFEAVEEYGTKIVSFPDGSAWFDLERSGCRIEAGAMGHCGNGYGRPGQTLLSYRRPVNTPDGTKWSSRMTFVLDKKTGVLGEMKGRANERPADRYHPYIVELLKKDIIKKVVGGGYMPEENFSLSHLKKDVINSLLAEKPSLFTVKTLVNIYYGCFEKCPIDIKDALKNTLDETPITIDEKRWYPISGDMNKDRLCKEFGLKELPNYTKELDDNHFPVDYFPGVNNHSYSENALDGVIENNPDIHARLIHELKQRIDQDDLDEIDLNTGRGLVKALVLENDDLKHAVETALLCGDETGAMNELQKAFDHYLKYPFDETSDLRIARNDNDPDNSFKLIASENYIFHLLSRDEFSEEADEYLWESLSYWIIENEKANDLEIPRYGFNDFDEEYAIESIIEKLEELLPEINSNKESNLAATEPFGSSTNPEAIAKFSMSEVSRQVIYDSNGMGI